jgi:hypothetical protein
MERGRSLRERARAGAALHAACRVVDDEIEIHGMAADVGIDERADRHHAESPLPGVVQGAFDQRRAEAATPDGRVDLGVQERHHVFSAIAVDELTGVLAGDQELVAALIGAKHDRDLALDQADEAIGRKLAAVACRLEFAADATVAWAAGPNASRLALGLLDVLDAEAAAHGLSVA